MSAAGIGRLFIASLHQAISEQIPARLSFYEPWLTSDGFRTSRVSLAGIRAAFSFLRKEEDGAYSVIMRRAGELAATWVWQDLTAVRRGWLRAMPGWARRRAAFRLARRVTSDAWKDTTSKTAWSRGEGRLSVRESLFCEVRTPVPDPLCLYYASAVQHFLGCLQVDTTVAITQCRATGGEACELTIPAASREAGRGTITVLLVGMLLAGGGVAASERAAVQVAPDGPRILVLPFENLSRDARLSWLGEGASLLLTDRLRQAGVDALTREERLQVFESLQVPPLASLSRATVFRLGQIVGARSVVTGVVRRQGEAVEIRMRRIVLDTGVMLPEQVEVAPASGLLAAFDRLAATLSTTPRRASAAVSTPPLAAFERYVSGLLAATPDAQEASLLAALSLHPGYDAARLALWEVRTAAGNHRAAIDAVRAVPDASPRSADAQFHLSLSYLALGQHTDAVAVLRALHDREPGAAVLNNIGLAVLREPALAARVGRATWFFSQARTTDPQEPDYLFNLGYAYWSEGDPSGAVYWLRECVRLTPADAEAHALLAQAMHAAGQTAEAYRELSLAQRLSSAFDGVELRSGLAPRGLGRLMDTREPWRARRMQATVDASAPQDQQALAAFYRERGRRLADKELDLAAESELTRAVYFAPYDAASHLLLGQIYLRSGRVRESIDAVKISLWSEESAAAHLVLAEAYFAVRDIPAARAEASRARALDPNSVHAAKLLERLQQ